MLRSLNGKLQSTIATVLIHKQQIFKNQQSLETLKSYIISLVGQQDTDMLFSIVVSSNQEANTLGVSGFIAKIEDLNHELAASAPYQDNTSTNKHTIQSPKQDPNFNNSFMNLESSSPIAMISNREDISQKSMILNGSKNSSPVRDFPERVLRMKTQTLQTEALEKSMISSSGRPRLRFKPRHYHMATEHSEPVQSSRNNINVSRAALFAQPPSPSIVEFIFEKYSKLPLGPMDKNTTFQDKSRFYKTLNYDKMIQFLSDYGASLTSDDRLQLIKIIKKHSFNSNFIEREQQFTKIYCELRRLFLLQDEQVQQYIQSLEAKDQQNITMQKTDNNKALINRTSRLKSLLQGIESGNKVVKGDFRKKMSQRIKQGNERTYVQNSLLQKLRLKELTWQALFQVRNADQYKDLTIPQIDFAQQEDQYFLSQFGSKEVQNSVPLKGQKNSSLGKGGKKGKMQVKLPILNPMPKNDSNASNKRTRSSSKHNLSQL